MNKIKKYSLALLIAGSVILTAGCSEDEKEEVPVGMPNPIVEVNGVDDFNTKLGIEMDDSNLPADSAYNIISDQIAEIKYTTKDVNNQEVSVTLRAQKNTTDDISGIYDDNMTEVTIEYDNFNVIHRISDSCNADIFDIEKDGIKYDVVIIGDSSQMQIASIMDMALVTFKLETFEK